MLTGEVYVGKMHVDSDNSSKIRIFDAVEELCFQGVVALHRTALLWDQPVHKTPVLFMTPRGDDRANVNLLPTKVQLIMKPQDWHYFYPPAGIAIIRSRCADVGY
jgi:hypothetical protein